MEAIHLNYCYFYLSVLDWYFIIQFITLRSRGINMDKSHDQASARKALVGLMLFWGFLRVIRNTGTRVQIDKITSFVWEFVKLNYL